MEFVDYNCVNVTNISFISKNVNFISFSNDEYILNNYKCILVEYLHWAIPINLMFYIIQAMLWFFTLIPRVVNNWGTVKCSWFCFMNSMLMYVSGNTPHLVVDLVVVVSLTLDYMFLFYDYRLILLLLNYQRSNLNSYKALTLLEEFVYIVEITFLWHFNNNMLVFIGNG